MGGVPPAAVTTYASHSTVQMTMRYAHLMPVTKHSRQRRCGCLLFGRRVSGRGSNWLLTPAVQAVLRRRVCCCKQSGEVAEPGWMHL